MDDCMENCRRTLLHLGIREPVPDACANRNLPGWPNHTKRSWPNFFYAEIENVGGANKPLYPIMVMISTVIVLVITISCIAIILGNIVGCKKAQLPPQRHRRRHRHRRHYCGDSESGQVSCHGQRPGDWLVPPGSSHRVVEASRLHQLHWDMNALPSYEECMEPGSTQLYPPTEAPPPYSLVDTNGGHGSGGYQQDHSDLHTVTVDALPPYEAVWRPCPPLSQLPLPGSELGPSSLQRPPTPEGNLASSPEMMV